MLVVPVVAFGPWFVEHARILLASLKSEGNLPDVASAVQVYTDDPGAFRGYEVIHLTPQELHKRGWPRESKHAITASCYSQAMRAGHPIVPVSADMICPTGMLAALERLARTKRVVLVPVLRTEARGMARALPIKDGVLSLAPRELCRLAFRHLHPLQARMYWDRRPSGTAPTSIFRRVGNTVAARCFHMHPLLLRLAPDTPLSPGIDGELMARMELDDCHVVTDSDETVVFDLTDGNYDWSAGYSIRFNAATPIEKWAYNKANKTHRWFFTEHECYVHSEDIERPGPDAELEALCEKVRALP